MNPPFLAPLRPRHLIEPASGGRQPEGRPVAPPGACVNLATSDLPAFCPNPSMPLWSSHPRVFLEVAHEREVMCPYCGTRYRLKDRASIHDDSPDAGRTRPEVGRRAPVVAADTLGNTTLELLTRWLTRR